MAIVHSDGFSIPSPDDVLMALHGASAGERIKSPTGSSEIIKTSDADAKLIAKVEVFRDAHKNGTLITEDWQRWLNRSAKNGLIKWTWNTEV